jgi:signal transduction histidine kinase
MSQQRDRAWALVAVLCILALGALVTVTLLDAQKRGREALRRNQESTIQQLANSMDQRIESALASVSGLAAQGFTLKVSDPQDQAKLDQLQSYNPEARSGMMLVDTRGVVTAGTLLTDPSVIGTRIDRPGLIEAARRDVGSVLPAADSLTTALPSIGLMLPVLDAEGEPMGGLLIESVIAIDSDFNKEISQLRQGETGQYAFIDELGTVIVATRADQLGKPIDESLHASEPGLHTVGEQVVGNAAVPSAGWSLIFSQDLEEFEAGLGRRVQLAVLLLVGFMLAAGAAAFVIVLRRLKAERAERERIQEINEIREEFISIVSHELRTPVAGIAGFLDSTLEHWGLLDDDAKRRAVTRARANARRLQALTRDVLDAGAVDSGELSYAFDLVDLAAEVEAGVDGARADHPDRMISVQSMPETAWVRADPDRIQQVLSNLLENALRNSPRAEQVSVSVTIESDHAIVSVRDHGPGIAGVDHEQLFEKWVRGRTAVTGTGLGLYISRMIVMAHHGELKAEEAAGGGAVFSFSIPLAASGAMTETARA